MDVKNKKPSREEVLEWPYELKELEVSMFCDSPVPLVAQRAINVINDRNNEITVETIMELWDLSESIEEQKDGAVAIDQDLGEQSLGVQA